MCYLVRKSDVKATVDDFKVFCDFVERARPFATQKGDLSTRACFDVNGSCGIQEARNNQKSR